MDIVDREFMQLDTTPLRRPGDKLFAVMVMLSCFLHLVSSIIVLSPRGTSLNPAPISYIDLKDIKFPEAPPASPAPRDEPASEPAEPQSPKATETVTSSTEPVSAMEQLRKEVKEAVSKGETNPEVLQQKSFGLGLTNGYFTSIAQGESLRGDIREYYFMMLRQINEKWWLAQGDKQSGGWREVVINVVVARNGTVLDKKLMRSSGNPVLDRSMMHALEAANPLPPLPASYELEVFVAPLKFVRPLNLFTSLSR